jgi:hypothetical protein
MLRMLMPMLCRGLALGCGVNNYTDYQLSPQWNRTYYSNNVSVVPIACCVLNTTTSAAWPLYTNCTYYPTTASAYIGTDCYTALSDQVAQYIYIVIGVLGGLGALLLLPIALAWCICCDKSTVGAV